MRMRKLQKGFALSESTDKESYLLYGHFISPPPPPMVRQLLVGQGLLLIEASQSHSDTPHSIGLLWTRDQPDAKTATWQHTTLTRQTSMPPAGFEPTIPASERPKTDAFDHRPPGSADCNLATINCFIKPFTAAVKNTETNDNQIRY